MPRIGHGVRGGLFHVGVAARFHGFSAVIGVLEISGGNNDGIHILARIQLVVIAHLVGAITAKFLDKIDALFAAHLPDVGNSHDLEVHVLGTLLKGRQIAALHAVAAAHNSHAHAIVGADDLRIALGVKRDCGCGQRRAARLQKLSAIVLNRFHDVFLCFWLAGGIVLP